MSLQVAVPMWISRMRRLDPDEIIAIGRTCTDEIASGADNAMYRGAPKKYSAAAFNSLARALAVLAYTPGGVTFMDCHWDANGTGSTP
jgi:hypothetical protein